MLHRIIERRRVMGNSIPVESGNTAAGQAGNTAAGQTTQPNGTTERRAAQPSGDPADSTRPSTDIGPEVTSDEQRRIHLEMENELARRKNAEAHATLERQEQELKVMQKQERLRLEEKRRLEMIAMQAIQAREDEQRKAEEVRTRQEREQKLKALQEQERLRLEEERRLEMLATQAKQAREDEQCKAEEIRARQKLEQVLNAMQEQGRLRLEEERRHEMLATQAKQAREDEQCKAEEIRARQELEQELNAMQEQGRLRLEEERRHEMLATQAKQAREEEQCKAEEIRARQKLEQKLEAIQEQERLRLEEEKRLEMLATQARQAREEKQRKAEEIRVRQEREQASKAMQEQERQRQEKVTAPPLCFSLPEVCRRFSTRQGSQGCTDPDCRRLHICRLFLADICKHGITCRNGHSLTTVHNQIICSMNNLDTAQELALVQQLRSAFQEKDELPEIEYLNNLETCHNFCPRSSCDQNECNRIHICRLFIAGVCRQAGFYVFCKFGHNLYTAHNNGVLRRHRLTKMKGKEIIDILRQKENRDALRDDRAASAVSYATNGAIPRHRSSGAGNEPSQPTTNGAIPRHRSPGADSQPSQPSRATDGLSEELQCPVCLEMFLGATTLGCGHTFCAHCLQEVRARRGNKCPLCRVHISSATRSFALDNIISSMFAKQ